MPKFESIFPGVADDTAYCVGMVLPSVESDLVDAVADAASTASGVLDPWLDGILGIVQFSQVGGGNTQSYVVMQTDLGDGAWVDVSWCQYNSTVPQTFALSGGGGASGPASPGANRATNVAPTTANGFNPILLGPRVRFVGKGPQGSSSSAGGGSSGQAVAVVKVTIKYRAFGKQ